MLANKFFHAKDVRMLLLSATPYKMYCTPEEIDEARARRAEEQAREDMKRANSQRDVALASAELSRAVSRIKASKHKHHL